jgi:hypothetical protein
MGKPFQYLPVLARVFEPAEFGVLAPKLQQFGLPPPNIS